MTAKRAIQPRSWLFVPADSEKKIAKSESVAADAIILDLEDAVAPDAKADARANAVAAAQSGAYGRREITIRANGLDTPWVARASGAAGGAVAGAGVHCRILCRG